MFGEVIFINQLTYWRKQMNRAEDDFEILKRITELQKQSEKELLKV